jgi:hypothetical protein
VTICDIGDRRHGRRSSFEEFAMDSIYIAAIAIVAIVILLLALLNRGRLQSLDVDFRKLLVRVKARPDSPSPVDPSSIKIRDTQLDDRSSINAPTTASVTADRNRLRGGSQINIYEPGAKPAPPERPEDRDA